MSDELYWLNLIDPEQGIVETTEAVQRAMGEILLKYRRPVVHLPDAQNWHHRNVTVVWQYHVSLGSKQGEYMPVIAANLTKARKGERHEIHLTTGLQHNLWNQPLLTTDVTLKLNDKTLPDKAKWDSFWDRLAMLGTVHTSRLIAMRKNLSTRVQHDVYLTCLRAGLAAGHRKNWHLILKALPDLGKDLNMVELFSLLTAQFQDSEMWTRSLFYGKVLDHLIQDVEPLSATRKVYRLPIRTAP